MLSLKKKERCRERTLFCKRDCLSVIIFVDDGCGDGTSTSRWVRVPILSCQKKATNDAL